MPTFPKSKIKQLIKTKDDDLLSEFPGFTRKELRQLKRKHKAIDDKMKAKQKLIDEEIKQIVKAITAVKQRGYSEKELQSKFDLSFAEIEKNKPSDYEIYYQRNEWNEQIIVLLQKPDNKIKIKPRAYSYSLQTDGQPYIWIKLPNIKSDKIKIIPVGDVHYGHNSCDVETFKQDIEYIKNNDNVYCVLGGDIVENASKLSVASGVYEQSSMPMEQVNQVVNLLAPIAHKILWSIPGNHEDRTYKHLGIDIAEYIAGKLEIPYFNQPVYADVMWKGYRWTFFDQHGSSSSQTKGGKINAASKPITWLEYTDFVLMHHVHDKMSNEITRIIRDTVNFRLKFVKQYIVVCSAYMRYFGNYGAKAGYAPPSTGRLAMKLYSNGKKYLGE